MNEGCTQAQDFFNRVFESLAFDLKAHAVKHDSGCVLNIEGADSSLLRSEGGELLDAVEQLANKIFAHQLPKGERIVCDAENFRATREAELRAMAHHAAERVRASGQPFTFGLLTANERRVIHLELQSDERLHSESIGEGNARRLRVSLKT
jgi:spoIIIJ-associated protein